MTAISVSWISDVNSVTLDVVEVFLELPDGEGKGALEN